MSGKDTQSTHQHPEGGIGVGVDVRMTRLVDIEEDEDGDGVHEGRVELEVGVVRADVVAAAHDAWNERPSIRSRSRRLRLLTLENQPYS